MNKPAKVIIIERSLSCFMWGLLGLIPVLGVPMALRAMQQNWRVSRDAKGTWNPAHRYLLWGIVCARVGVFAFIILLGAALIIVSNANGGAASLNGHSLCRIF